VLVRVPELTYARIIESNRFLLRSRRGVARENSYPDNADTEPGFRKSFDNRLVYRPGTLLASARSHGGQQSEKSNFVTVAVEMIYQQL
jgi:hypothetical protein